MIIDVEKTVYLNVGFKLGELLFGDNDYKSPVQFAVIEEDDED